jgi:hypothetical protein
MRSKKRLTIATAVAVAALAAAPPLAIADWNVEGSPPNDVSGNATSQPGTGAGSDSSASDVRGEHAASLSQTSSGTAPDQRSPDARDQFVRPVVVEVGEPVADGFDWTSALAGVAGGLALALLAGVAVAAARRRQVRPSVG